MQEGDTRLAVTAAAATVLAALTLRPTVEGWGWLLATVVVVAVVGVTGAAVRQLTSALPVVAVAQLVAYAVTVTALFARDRALWGVVPDVEAIEAMRALLEAGAEVTRQQAAPVQAHRGVILLIAGGVGLVAVVVDLVAVTMRRPAVAGLALLAVYCVPAAVLPGGLPWYWFALAAVGYLALVSADAADRVRAWGRVLGSGDGDAGWGGWRSGTAGRTAFSAVAIAVVLPLLVPSLGESVLGSSEFAGTGEGDGENLGYVNPILDLRQNLTRRSEEVALTFRTTAEVPPLLRIVADEEFDGRAWSPARRVPNRDNRVQDGLPSPPGMNRDVATTPVRTDVTVAGLNQSYLPVPYPASSIDVEGEWIYDPATLDVRGWETSTRDLAYTVQHLQVRPTAQQLEAAPPPPPALFGPFTQVPADLPPLVGEMARAVAGTGSAYQRATRLQRWFRSGGNFQYSTDAPGIGPDDGSSAVMETFLQERRGYCVHFASAMAVMARTLGIPSRVAVGFLPGERIAENQYEVTFARAHAWPELYFEGVGWTRFEPTPPVQSGPAPGYTVTLDGIEDQPEASESPAPSASANPDGNADAADDRSSADDGQGLRELLSRVPWRVVIAVLLLVGIGLSPRGLAMARRRRRWRGVTGRRERAEAAWDEVRERLGDLGVEWPRSLTPRAVRARLVEEWALGDPAASALDRLVADLESARYGRPDGEGGRTSAALLEDVDLVVDVVAARTPPAVRRRARWLPSSAFTGLSDSSWGSTGDGEGDSESMTRAEDREDRVPESVGR